MNTTCKMACVGSCSVSSALRRTKPKLLMRCCKAGDIKMPFSHHHGVSWQTYTQIYVPSHAHPAACPQAGAIPPCLLDAHAAQPRSLALPEHNSHSSKDKHAEIFKQSDSCLIEWRSAIQISAKEARAAQRALLKGANNRVPQKNPDLHASPTLLRWWGQGAGSPGGAWRAVTPAPLCAPGMREKERKEKKRKRVREGARGCHTPRDGAVAPRCGSAQLRAGAWGCSGSGKGGV